MTQNKLENIFYKLTLAIVYLCWRTYEVWTRNPCTEFFSTNVETL